MEIHQNEKQAFDKIEDIKEDIECNQSGLELMKKVSEARQKDDLDEFSKLIPIVAETEDEDLKNFCRKYLQHKQNEYIFTVVSQTFIIAAGIFVFSFMFTGLCAILLESNLAIIIGGSVAGGLTVLSTIVACFAACTSAHVSMLKNLGSVLKKQNDVQEERDDLKSKETNDPLSESYPLSEILENSDRDPCVPEQI
jgi:hypothetical protein